MKDYERAVQELKNQVETATNEADAAKRGNFFFIILDSSNTITVIICKQFPTIVEHFPTICKHFTSS